MKKKTMVLLPAVILMILTIGCKKNENISTEATSIPVKETTEITQVLEEETRMTTETELVETYKPTESPDPTENIPISTEISKSTEITSSASQILPGDNWETPDL